jgi:DNA-binding response OmpR family regulator
MPEGAAPVVQPAAVVDRPAAADLGDAQSRPRVLIVEDDLNAAELLADTLEAAGFTAQKARTGEEAMAMVERQPPALVTLDLMLPGVDGWAVLRSLKRRPETHNVPVVIVSVVDNRDLAIALGADDFFVKPVPHDALLERLQQLAAPQSTPGPGTVLVIDDDPVVHELLQHRFQPLGLRLFQAVDGTSGVAVAIAERPAVIVLDLKLPDIDGFEVATRLRENPATASIPIVVLTALDLGPAELERLRGRIVALQQKVDPWPVELVETVRGLLSRNSVNHQLPGD